MTTLDRIGLWQYNIAINRFGRKEVRDWISFII